MNNIRQFLFFGNAIILCGALYLLTNSTDIVLQELSKAGLIVSLLLFLQIATYQHTNRYRHKS